MRIAQLHATLAYSYFTGVYVKNGVILVQLNRPWLIDTGI